MAYNKRQKLAGNIQALELALNLESTKRVATDAEKDVLRKYSGFGGLKFILNPCEQDEDIERWSKTDRVFFEDTKRLYAMLKFHSKDENEYHAYVQSMRNSVLTSFYTPKPVVNAISGALKIAGLDIRTFLDPCSGRGTFVDAFQDGRKNLEVTAFEKDLLTGMVLQALHGECDIHVAGYETIDDSYQNHFDVVSSNIPFGVVNVFDPSFTNSGEEAKVESTKTLHNYFFLKTIDQVRDGGLIAFITSQGVMDSPKNKAIRHALLDKAYLVGVVRLPNNLFTDEAGTEVSSDLILLQKDSNKPADYFDAAPDEQAFVENLLDFDDELETLDFDDEEQSWFRQTNPNAYIFCSQYLWDAEDPYLGETSRGTDPYGKPTTVCKWEGTIEELGEALQRRLYGFLQHEFKHQLYKEHANDNINPNVHMNPSFNNTGRSFTQDVKNKTKGQDDSPAVQMSLFDLWDDAGAGSEEHEAGASMEPRTYSGNLFPFYRAGIIVEDDGQMGTLSTVGKEWRFTPLPLSKIDEERLHLYVKVRDAYEALYRHEAKHQEADDEGRTVLNDHYNTFLLRYGALNEKKNVKAILMDAMGRDTLSLERGENGKFVKSDIFFKPVSFQVVEVTHVDTAEEALMASLNKSGTVNLAYMSDLTGLSYEELQEQLVGRIYYNPLALASQGTVFEIADKFLSGNVVEKLNKLRQYETPEDSEALKRSIVALEEVVPRQIPFEELDFNFGERWMPAQYFGEFASEFFEADIDIQYAPNLDEFAVNCQSWNEKITSEYAVQGESKNFNGIDLLIHALYDTTPVINKVIGYKPNGDAVLGPDHEKIQLAASKIDQIRDAFTDWIGKQPQEWKDEMVHLYNRTFNCFVRAKYDGSHQTFPDLDLKSLKAKKGINEVYGSQKDAVWMILQNGGGICDHEVGTGKTLIMCLAAHEMKRLGLCHKPIIIGMKANVNEIAATYQSAYPNDRILYAPTESADFKDREGFFNRIKNNDYDCIIMSHDQFNRIPQSQETMREVMYEELHALEEALAVYAKQTNSSISSRQLKGLEQRKENLLAELQELNYKLLHRADDVVDFKTMGIDHIFVDESQQFKNLRFTTRFNRVAGLGDPKGSDRARNLQYAIRTIQDRTGRDLGATFLSGTTISNSLTELYLLFQYMRPQALDAQNIHSFDAWAAIFARKSRDYEINVAGQIVMKERYRHFIKVPELATFYNEVTDYKTAADVGLERPKMDIRLENIEPTEDQKDFAERLIKFAENGDGNLVFRPELNDSEKQAKMLLVTGMGKKASLSPVLVNPDYHEGDDTKIGHAAKNIAEINRKYDEWKGTQFVFCDLSTPKKGEWSVYQELKDRLVNEYGIPEQEIQFIQDHNTEKKRKAVIDKMNKGDVRILMGSTTTLGTGVNAQERAVAVHHLDLPWRPSDMEQRNGRAVRKGNLVARDHANNKVEVFVYAVERSLDSYNFYLLQAKSDFIRQMKTGSLGKRDFDQGGEDEENGMPFAKYVAITSGNTDLLERAKLKKKILGLESERKAFYKQQTVNQRKLDDARHQLGHYERVLEKLTQDKDVLENVFSSNYDSSVDGFAQMAEDTTLLSYHNQERDEQLKRISFDSSKDYPLGDYLQQAARVVVRDEVNVLNLQADGLDWPVVMTSKDEYNSKTGVSHWVGNYFAVKGASGILYTYGTGKVNLVSAEKAGKYPFLALSRIPEMIKNHEVKRREFAEKIPELERIVGKEWEKTDELKQLKEQMQELDRKINQDMDIKTLQQDGKVGTAEDLFYEIEHHNWGRQPWELKYMLSDYPLVSRDELNDIGEKFHGHIRIFNDDVRGDFRHQFGAESAMKEISRLNAEHRKDVEWLKDVVREGYDKSTAFAYRRLKELGLDRYGNPLSSADAKPLQVYSLANYADVRDLAHGVKDGVDPAIEVSAKAMANAIRENFDVDKIGLTFMPSHKGYGGSSKELCKAVSEQLGISYQEALYSAGYESIYTWKKEHPDEPLPELFFKEYEQVNFEGKTPIIIDNVVDTGHTAVAALEAMREQPVFLVIGHSGHLDGEGHPVEMNMLSDGFKYIREATPEGVGYTGKSHEEIEGMLRRVHSNDSTLRRDLRNLGLDYYTGYPLYQVEHIVEKYEFTYSGLDQPADALVDKGTMEDIFTEQEMAKISDYDQKKFREALSLVKEDGNDSYTDKRSLLIMYDLIQEKLEKGEASGIEMPKETVHSSPMVSGISEEPVAVNRENHAIRAMKERDRDYFRVREEDGKYIVDLGDKIDVLSDDMPGWFGKTDQKLTGGFVKSTSFIDAISNRGVFLDRNIAERFATDANVYYNNKMRKLEAQADSRKNLDRTLRDLLIDRMREAGVSVVTDVEEGQRILANVPYGVKLASSEQRIIASEMEEDASEVRYSKVSSYPIFISNAKMAVERIQQEKATPIQWLHMITKNGGIKAGEDKWMGLSAWLKENKRKTLTKDEVLNYIRGNQIDVHEVHYMEDLTHSPYVQDLQQQYDEYVAEAEAVTGSVYTSDYDDYAYHQMAKAYGDDFRLAFEHEDGKLVVADPYIAAHFAHINQIDDTHLNYVTGGLANNREIALTVPSIESWNPDDELHFGDADDGRAVVWVRFGETYVKREVNEQEMAQRSSTMPSAEQWESVEESINGMVHHFYFYPGTRHQVGHSFIYDNVDGTFSIGGPMTRSMSVTQYNSMEDAVKAFNQQWIIERSRKYHEKVLVIDEIQSKRHQEGRVKGYKDAGADRRNGAKYEELMRKYGVSVPAQLEAVEMDDADKAVYEVLRSPSSSTIPDAPFAKNWYELAMKRMLRYAAENAYDKMAWTTGEWQGDRYDLGILIKNVHVSPHVAASASETDGFDLDIATEDEDNMTYLSLFATRDGLVSSIDHPEYHNKHLSDVVGKTLAAKILAVKEVTDISGDYLRMGIEGMITFYDKMLVNFMNKYGRQWGVKVEDLHLNHIGSVLGGMTLHSVSVTDSMKGSVMMGQPMFFKTSDGQAYGFVKDDVIYIDPRIATAETPIHEYTHLWAEVLRQVNPKEWMNIVNLMKDATELWEKVKIDYPEIEKEDDIAEEVLAQYSGKRGHQYLMETVKEMECQHVLDKISEALAAFWHAVTDFLHIHYTSKEEVADQVLHDLLTGINPLTYLKKAPDQTQAAAFKEWFGDWKNAKVLREMNLPVLQDTDNHEVINTLKEEEHENVKHLSKVQEAGSEEQEVLLAAYEEARDVLYQADLVNVPLSPDMSVHVKETGQVYGYPTMTNDSLIHVFEKRYDAYDYKNGTSLSELPIDKQLEVLDAIKEHYGDESTSLSILIDTKEVPAYAAGAIVNDDFSGIEDAEDEKNIRDFMRREAYKGAIFSPRTYEPSFSTSPAFGFPCDCYTMDVIRFATVKELREERQAVIKNLPFPEEELGRLKENVHHEKSVINLKNSNELDRRNEPVVPRPLTLADREAGGALVDHLQKMGITVHTDNSENRRILKAARQDHSEVGRLRHFKTEDGKNYGFAYKGGIYLDLRKMDAELPLHEYAHLWAESLRRINPNNWNHVVTLMKQDADTWQYVKNTYPELTGDSALAEEVIARFSGKRGAQKLRDELNRLSLRDASYQSRWGNIFQNVSKSIQDFWGNVGDYLGIRYVSKEEIADQILKDFSNQVNPIKKVERWLLERDKEYATAVAAGDMDTARDLFAAALQEHLGNGITPFIAVDGYRGKLDRLARQVKDSADNSDAILEAADLMAPLVPANAVLVPAPSHQGYATDMLALAHAISERVHAPVCDVLKGAPRERQYDAKKTTGHPLTAENLGIRLEGKLPEGKLPVIIDNVVHSGNTAEACVKALGGGIVCSLASAVSQDRHVSSLKSAYPVVYDKAGTLIPLSQRFELKNKYLGRVTGDKELNTNTVVQGLESYSMEELESQVRQHAKNVISEFFSTEDINIIKITFIGSRTRGEAHAGSDLDVLVEYEGEGVREDTFFNALNEEPLEIEGIRVDMNPIHPHYSLNTEEWLARDARWRKEDQQKHINPSEQMEAKDILKSKFDAFVKEHQEEPKYAEVTIRFKDDDAQESVLIQLDHGADPRTDDRIFYYCGGLKDLERLTHSEGKEDFQVVDVESTNFHGKNMLLSKEEGWNAEAHTEPQKPYQIMTGEASTPDVTGEFHVNFSNHINAVSFKEMQQMAQEHGGQMRIRNGQEWADFITYNDAEKFAEAVVALNDKYMEKVKDDMESQKKLTAIGYPYNQSVHQDGSINIPTLDERLYWEYAAGIISVQEAARQFASAGWTNFVDEKYTIRKFSKINEMWGKLTPEQLGESKKISPIMKQFHQLKEKHPEALLLFRHGDFYEAYQEDAKKCADLLGITLTEKTHLKDSQGKRVKMAGFPYPALDTYLPKLIRAQMRVAICDSIVEPKLKKSEEQGERRKAEDRHKTEEVKKDNKDVHEGVDCPTPSIHNFSDPTVPAPTFNSLEDIELAHSAVLENLKKYNDDYYHVDLDVNVLAPTHSKVETWEEMQDLASSISRNLLMLAVEREPDIMKRYGVTFDSESRDMSTMAIDYAKAVLYNQQNRMEEKMDGLVSELNAVLKDYNHLEDAHMSKFIQQNHAQSYSIEKKNNNSFALLMEKEEGMHYVTSYMNPIALIKKKEDIKKDMIEKYPAEFRALREKPEVGDKQTNLLDNMNKNEVRRKNENIQSSSEVIPTNNSINNSKNNNVMSENDDNKKVQQELMAQQPEGNVQEQANLSAQVNNDEGLNKKAGRFAKMDYTKYQLPEGATLVSAIINPIEGEAEKYRLDAVVDIQGEQKEMSAPLYKNNVADLEIGKVDAMGLAPLLLRKQVAEMMGVELPKSQEAARSGEKPNAEKAEKVKTPEDYSQYHMADGVVVEKANVHQSKNDAKVWEVSAVIDGKWKTAKLFPNEVHDFFEKGPDGKRIGKVTAEMLIAKKFGVEAEARKEQRKAEKAENAKKVEDQKAQEEKKKQEEQKSKPKDEKVNYAFTHSLMIATALAAAKDNGGIWMNATGKPAPSFFKSPTIVNGFNALLMGLHSDANKFKSNVYVNFLKAQAEGAPVKHNQDSLRYNFKNWNTYVSQVDKNDVITHDQYEKLSEEERSLYKVQMVTENRPIFNIDQTMLSVNKREEYEGLITQPVKALTAVEVMDKLMAENPDKILVFKNDDKFSIVGDQAITVAKDLGDVPVKSLVDGKEHLDFSEDQLNDVIEQLQKGETTVAVVSSIDDSALMERFPDVEAIVMKGDQLVESIRQTGGKVAMVDNDIVTEYDREQDVLQVNERKSYAVGSERSQALDRVADIYRAAVAYIGAESRLNRPYDATVPIDADVPKNAARQEKLIQELAAGVMMASEGLPAKLSKEGQSLVSYWERELKENPRLINYIERHVDNAVKVLKDIQKGEQVDYAQLRGKPRDVSGEAKVVSRTIARQISDLPDADKKTMVIVKDMANKTADVLLPAGASINVNNEIPGLNKKRIHIALQKEGFDEIKFFNAGGELGFKESNGYFTDKEVFEAKLNSYEVQYINKLDIPELLKRDDHIEVKDFKMTTSNDGKRAFYVRPADERIKPFVIKAEGADIMKFIEALKTKDRKVIEGVRNELSQKYYVLVNEKPEMKREVTPLINDEVDVKRITNVSMKKVPQSEKKPDTYTMSATIDGVKSTKDITREDFEKLFMVEDKSAFRIALTTQVFAQELGIQKGEERQFRFDGQEPTEASENTEFQENEEKEENVEEEAPIRSGGLGR